MALSADQKMRGIQNWVPGNADKDSIVYADTFGPAAFIVKARVQLMRDLGSAPSPMNAFLLNLGMETLHLRMERHCRNAEAVAAFLERWMDFRVIPATNNPHLVRHLTAEGYLRLSPRSSATDGFFVAVLERAKWTPQ